MNFGGSAVEPEPDSAARFGPVGSGGGSDDGGRLRSFRIGFPAAVAAALQRNAAQNMPGRRPLRRQSAVISRCASGHSGGGALR